MADNGLDRGLPDQIGPGEKMKWYQKIADFCLYIYFPAIWRMKWIRILGLEDDEDKQ